MTCCTKDTGDAGDKIWGIKQEASLAPRGCKYQLSALKICTLYFDIFCPNV